jgi:hypothetical protein
MARRYFLVFKGHVEYHPDDNHIICWSLQECFFIKLGVATKVITRGARRIVFRDSGYTYYSGYELLANGERYWVRRGERN